MKLFLDISKPVSGFLAGIGIGQLFKDGRHGPAICLSIAIALFVFREIYFRINK